MRYYLIFYVSLFVVNTAKTQNYRLEDQLLKGIYEVADSMGVDLNEEFRKFENYQIACGVLQNNSEKSYYESFERIAEGKSNYTSQLSMPDSINFNKDFHKLITSKTNMKNLKKVFEDKSFKKSRLQSFLSVVNSALILPEINSQTVSSLIIKPLKPEDFGHNYYKMTSFFWLYLLLDYDDGIKRSKDY